MEIQESKKNKKTRSKEKQSNKDACDRTVLEQRVRRRVALEERAFRVVERLVEETVTEHELANLGQAIDPSHYDDICEERFLADLCGYPVCPRTVAQVLKQKFIISTKSNQVYDITERKRFCSGWCYEASRHFSAQISQSPVSLRDNEPPVNFTFLTRDHRGRMGRNVLVTARSELARDLATLDEIDARDSRSQQRLQAAFGAKQTNPSDSTNTDINAGDVSSQNVLKETPIIATDQAKTCENNVAMNTAMSVPESVTCPTGDTNTMTSRDGDPSVIQQASARLQPPTSDPIDAVALRLDEMCVGVAEDNKATSSSELPTATSSQHQDLGTPWDLPSHETTGRERLAESQHVTTLSTNTVINKDITVDPDTLISAADQLSASLPSPANGNVTEDSNSVTACGRNTGIIRDTRDLDTGVSDLPDCFATVCESLSQEATPLHVNCDSEIERTAFDKAGDCTGEVYDPTSDAPSVDISNPNSTLYDGPDPVIPAGDLVTSTISGMAGSESESAILRMRLAMYGVDNVRQYRVDELLCVDVSDRPNQHQSLNDAEHVSFYQSGKTHKTHKTLEGRNCQKYSAHSNCLQQNSTSDSLYAHSNVHNVTNSLSKNSKTESQALTSKNTSSCTGRAQKIESGSSQESAQSAGGLWRNKRSQTDSDRRWMAQPGERLGFDYQGRDSVYGLQHEQQLCKAEANKELLLRQLRLQGSEQLKQTATDAAGSSVIEPADLQQKALSVETTSFQHTQPTVLNFKLRSRIGTPSDESLLKPSEIASVGDSQSLLLSNGVGSTTDAPSLSNASETATVCETANNKVSLLLQLLDKRDKLKRLEMNAQLNVAYESGSSVPCHYQPTHSPQTASIVTENVSVSNDDSAHTQGISKPSQARRAVLLSNIERAAGQRKVLTGAQTSGEQIDSDDDVEDVCGDVRKNCVNTQSSAGMPRVQGKNSLHSRQATDHKNTDYDDISNRLQNLNTAEFISRSREADNGFSGQSSEGVAARQQRTHVEGESSAQVSSLPTGAPVAKEPSPAVNMFKFVQQVLFEWRSGESVRWLLGKEGEDGGANEGDEFERRYAELGRRVDRYAKVDMLGDLGASDDEDSGDQPRGRLPDLAELKQAGPQSMDVTEREPAVKQGEACEEDPKVRRFMKKNFPMQEPSSGTYNRYEIVTSQEIVLPPVDSCSQLSIRRSLVLDRLSKALPKLLSPLRMTLSEVAPSVRKLVSTFRLSSKNVTLKPAAWTIMALLLLKLLAMRLPRMRDALLLLSARTHVTQLCEAAHVTEGQLDHVVRKFTRKH